MNREPRTVNREPRTVNCKPESRIDRTILYGVIFLLIFAPLAFGSVHVWAYGIIEFGVFLLLLLWFFDRLILSGSDTLAWVKTPVNLILMMFLVLIGLQLIPLPAPIVALLSPETHADKTRLFKLMSKAAGGCADGPSWMMMSYSIHPTLLEWVKSGTYCGMFFLVLNTVTSRKQINILVYTLIFIGLFEAVYAIFQVFSVTPRVWWWKSRVGASRFASGTFIVSNHFAACMEMVLCLTFGFLIAQKRRTRQMIPGSGSPRTFLKNFVSWFSPESVRPKMIFFFFVALLMGVSLLLSASRGGILSLGFTMLLMALLFYSKKRYKTYGGLALCLCAAIIAYGLHVGIDPTLEKFENPKNLYGRFHITRTIIPMIKDYPFSGVGLGNFRYIYPRYIDDYDRVRASGYAHNDWVEAGTETGFPGLLLIFLAFAIYITKMIRIWRRRRDFHALGIGAGVMAGLLSIGMHSYFDFNMHIPANPLTLAALLAIGYAAVHRQGHGHNESFFYRKREIPMTRYRRVGILALVLFVSAFSVRSVGKHILAEAACPTEWNSTLNLTWNPERSDIEKAIAYNPCNFEYHYKRAEHFMSLDAASEKDEKAFHIEAQKSLEQAVRRNPARGMLWYELGTIYSSGKYDLFDYLNKWLPLADECFDEGIKCAPMNEYILFNVAWHWVWRAGLLPEKKEEKRNIEHHPSEIETKFHRDETKEHTGFTGQSGIKMMNKKAGEGRGYYREDGIKKFQDLFRRSLDINPRRWKKAVDRVWKYFPDDAVVIGIVPEHNEKLKSLVKASLEEKRNIAPGHRVGP
jgi:O-antigen ligase/tetratricopeptide (TPR) repeat protein